MEEGLRSGANQQAQRPAEGSRWRLSFVTQLEHDLNKLKPEITNALLVVLGLILTMTYQALVSPPGSVVQGEGNNAGKSVMKPVHFALFFAPNTLAFLMAWAVTISLLSLAVAKSIISLVTPLYVCICFCYGVALILIAPTFATGGVTFALAAVGQFLIVTYYSHKKTAGNV